MKKKLKKFTVIVGVTTSYELEVESTDSLQAWDDTQEMLDQKGLDHEVLEVLKA